MYHCPTQAILMRLFPSEVFLIGHAACIPRLDYGRLLLHLCLISLEALTRGRGVGRKNVGGREGEYCHKANLVSGHLCPSLTLTL